MDKEGAMVWLEKEEWIAVDYIVAEELLSFYRYWYDIYCNCYDAVLAMHNTQPSIRLDYVVSRMMEEGYLIDRKIRAGILTATPAELVNAKSIITKME